MAGDKIVEFVVSKSTTDEGMLTEFLKERIHRGTTWIYDPPVDMGGGLYGVTAKASTQTNEIMPVRVINLSSSATADASDFREVYTIPFHLTVDLESSSVSDWRVHAEEATYETNRPEEVGIKDVLSEKAAECMYAAFEKSVPKDALSTIFRKTEERGETEAMELREAVSAAGISDACEGWVGEVAKK